MPILLLYMNLIKMLLIVVYGSLVLDPYVLRLVWLVSFILAIPFIFVLILGVLSMVLILKVVVLFIIIILT